MDGFILQRKLYPSGLVDDESEGDGPEFIVNKPATGWTDEDNLILERALDLAGIRDTGARMAAAMGVDTMGIICLAPLVKSVDSGLGQIKKYFDRIKGGIGK